MRIVQHLQKRDMYVLLYIEIRGITAQLTVFYPLVFSVD